MLVMDIGYSNYLNEKICLLAWRPNICYQSIKLSHGKGCKVVFSLYMKTPPLINMHLLVEEAF